MKQCFCIFDYYNESEIICPVHTGTYLPNNFESYGNEYVLNLNDKGLYLDVLTNRTKVNLVKAFVFCSPF